mmetsp:Transcript_79359/g.220818  ORF Transcript_79359/g.220818 Transcript_79359/m.220818 type:complete len:468 (-) Transcript_79359:97-1500(-)|eukprot:CAMPEP_0117554468 /NCGR_PEP_ID=MMETSP0784-20121206/50771_1 /TAXON_ID=39447 /ORGANISM="" /LENGTH=467 /DNA_ID=CAMNT_0005351637 /DNA_START=48 /DNA_END=1451 /DNA_ORIENTATION=+
MAAREPDLGARATTSLVTESEEEQRPSPLRPMASWVFIVLGFCFVVGTILVLTGSSPRPVGLGRGAPPVDAGFDSEDLEIDFVPKPAGESWSFDLELAPRRVELPDGTFYDPTVVPALYADGCEDTPGWTNGFENCGNERVLAGGLGADAFNATYCQPTGFTCAAYVAHGWCGEDWATGPFSNFPERHCCGCGGGTTVMQLTAECGRAPAQCAKAVKYAKYVGIRHHPALYPGLSEKSSFEAFQAFISRRDPSAKCPPPCEGSLVGAPPATTSAPAHVVDDEAAESSTGCPPKEFDPKSNKKGPAYCFAQLASNTGVAKTPCTCRQGCTADILVASTNETVSFKNVRGLGYTRGACARDVLLTIPRDFYKHYADVHDSCGHGGMEKMFEVIMRDAFDAFNSKLCQSSLWQCFHSPRTASVPYIHMQTFSAAGFFHGMPTSNKYSAICVKQSHRDESKELAVKLAAMV